MLSVLQFFLLERTPEKLTWATPLLLVPWELNYNQYESDHIRNIRDVVLSLQVQAR